MIAKLKKKATKTQEPPSSIIATTTGNANNASAAQLPHLSLLTRTIQRTRKKNNPTPPEPVTAKEFNIPVQYTLTQKEEQFLYYDSKDDNKTHRTIIFTTESNLTTLGAAEIWQADGTFDAVPRIFSQLYTIHAYIDHQAIPMVYILTTTKTTKLYKTVLQKIQNMSENMNPPKQIICDYEKAFMKAVKKTHPETQITGCFFHLSQCIWHKIQEAGLQVQYSEDSILALNLKMLAALAFVPEKDVIYAFEKLLKTKYYTQNEKKLEPVIDYFEKTWIGLMNRRQERQPPHYEINLWNQYESVKNNTPRTNNSVEGWHGAFNKRAQGHHLPLWKMMDLLKKEQNLTDVKLSQIEAGTISPAKKRKYRQADTRIKNIVDAYTRKQVISYLRGLANNINY
uniref:MULE transposase domain-containing protein n=1 Tax=Bracon brevicornis TaxID=1563983 RepID=A0A6V7JV94_9HYME